MNDSKLEIRTSLYKNKPLIQINISYKDEFTNDKYFIESYCDNMNDMEFILLKNDNEVSKLNLSNKNVEDFIHEVFKKINDYDVKKDFEKKHYNHLLSEMKTFINEVDSSIIIENKLVKGYKDKMKMMSGIYGLNKNIR